MLSAFNVGQRRLLSTRCSAKEGPLRVSHTQLRSSFTLLAWRRQRQCAAHAYGVNGASAHLRSCQCLHTSTLRCAPTSPTARTLGRATSSASSSAADGLLSQWSRRSPTPTSTTQRVVATPATAVSPTVPPLTVNKDFTVDSPSVEELFLFDEVDDANSTAVLQDGQEGSAEASRVPHPSHGRNTAATAVNVAVSAVADKAATFAEETPLSSFVQHNEMGEEDTEVYGIAASAAARESQLMEDLLRQATMDSADVDDVAEDNNAVSDGDVDDTQGDLPLQRDDAPDSRETASASPTLAASQPAERRERFSSSISDSPSTAESSSVSGNETVRGDAAGKYASFDSMTDAAAMEDAPATSEEETRSAEESNTEDEEDDSMDTVLEEETERMLQAALANMMQETAANAAATATTSRATSGSDGFVFFTREAVMAAAQSLAAAEQASSSPSSLKATHIDATVTSAGDAEYDDDAARAAEIESVGLNMETARR